MTAPLHLPIETRRQFHDALREAFAEMARVGCREAWISDEDFADWPLGELAVIEHLGAWAMSHRRLVVVARHYDEVVRRHARWVEWRRQWSHVVECRAFEEAEVGQIPTLLLAADLLAVRLVDPLRHRGAVSRETGDLLRFRELIDAVSQRSVESFPATILGL
ncbi:hypothetical protein [Piscinibacter sp. XHJ-5]|uniref:hypothetical protein n=1 Tax=Piscinibacter sp. XHJ-5 TaxID=3037797 RepID=UPI0024535BE1|nr:hypothetical protein [Piscinibacter sp. XHJ-5]